MRFHRHFNAVLLIDKFFNLNDEAHMSGSENDPASLQLRTMMGRQLAIRTALSVLLSQFSGNQQLLVALRDAMEKTNASLQGRGKARFSRRSAHLYNHVDGSAGIVNFRIAYRFPKRKTGSVLPVISPTTTNYYLLSFLWLWRPASACCSLLPPRVLPVLLAFALLPSFRFDCSFD